MSHWLTVTQFELNEARVPSHHTHLAVYRDILWGSGTDDDSALDAAVQRLADGGNSLEQATRLGFGLMVGPFKLHPQVTSEDCPSAVVELASRVERFLWKTGSLVIVRGDIPSDVSCLLQGWYNHASDWERLNIDERTKVVAHTPRVLAALDSCKHLPSTSQVPARMPFPF